MIVNIVRSPAVRLGRNLAAVLLVVMWGSARPAANPGVARISCSNSADCGGGVCDPNTFTCEPCDYYPEGCDDYAIYSNLVDPFCDEQSGNCWENSDCLVPGENWVGDPCLEQCVPCNSVEGCAYDCPDPTNWCDDQFGQCEYVPGQ